MKDGKCNDSETTDEDIDNLCDQCKKMYLLWDGVVAVARTTNPTEIDRTLYCRYANAAVYSHMRSGYNVIHIVHLMWAHVAKQLKILCGLGCCCRGLG